MRRTITGPVHRPVRLARAPWLLALVSVVALLSGCVSQPSSVFNQAAPLPAETVVAYITGGRNTPNNVTPNNVVKGVRGRDGTPLWQMGIGGGTDIPPVVVGGVLYAEAEQLPGPAGRPPPAAVVAVRLRDGALLWHVDLPAANVGVTADATSVLVAAGLAGLYAFNPADGSIRWHQPLPLLVDPRFSQPHAAAGVVVVNPVRGGLTAFRESDGALLWQAPDDLQNIGMQNIAMNQLAVYGNSDGFLFVYALADGTPPKDWQPPPYGRNDATVLGVSAQLVLLETHLPTGDQLVALDAHTGQARWHSTHQVDSVIFASRSGAAPTIYAAKDGEVMALRSTDGVSLWQTALTGYEHGVVSGMIDLEGALVFLVEPPYYTCSLFGCSGPTYVRLMALDAATGAISWWRDLPDGHLLGRPAPAT